MSMKIFCCAARTLNFSQAASSLHISPAMVSKHISALEAHLGVALFNRTTRQIQLTEEGLAFHLQCQVILDDLEELEAAIRGDNLAVSGRLRLSVPMDFGVKVLAPILTEYLHRHPKVSMEVVYDDGYVDLIGEGFDMAIRIGGQFPNSTLVAQRLAPTEAIVCASRAYLQNHPPIRRPSDLRRHNCIQYSHFSDPRQWHLQGPNGDEVITINGNLCSNNGQSMLNAVLNGLGIALLPRFLVDTPLAEGTLKWVLPDYRVAHWGIYAVYPRLSYLPAKVRSLIDFIAQGLKTEAPLQVVATSHAPAMRQ